MRIRYLTIVLIFLFIVPFIFAVEQSHPTSQLATNDAERNSDLNLSARDILLRSVKGVTGSYIINLVGTGTSTIHNLHLVSNLDVDGEATIANGLTVSAGIVSLPDGEIGSLEIENGAITNDDISATAGIVDTKLAQITSTGKVSGAALTLLNTVPGGAGLLPAANIPNLENLNGAVTSAKIQDGAVTSADILNGEVKTDDIEDSAVTTAKIAQIQCGTNEGLIALGNGITGGFDCTTLADPNAITGTGTVNTIPIFTNTRVIGDSLISQASGNVRVNAPLQLQNNDCIKNAAGNCKITFDSNGNVIINI